MHYNANIQMLSIFVEDVGASDGHPLQFSGERGKWSETGRRLRQQGLSVSGIQTAQRDGWAASGRPPALG
jgi:hypothetical protein